MKIIPKVIAAVAVLAVPTTSLGSVSAFAAETTKLPLKHERPAFSANAGVRTGDLKFSEMRNFKFRERLELTEEEKAAKIEAFKNSLAEKLADGKITQERYDEIIANHEPGQFPLAGKGLESMKGKRPGKVALTEEEKAAKLENIKSSFSGKFADGEIKTPKMNLGKMPGKFSPKRNADTSLVVAEQK